MFWEYKWIYFIIWENEQSDSAINVIVCVEVKDSVTIRSHSEDRMTNLIS